MDAGEGVLIVFACTSETAFPSLYRTWRWANDSPNSLQPTVLLQPEMASWG